MLLYIPVSYTHLDVYKRQAVMRSSLESISPKICNLCNHFSIELRQSGRGHEEPRNSEFAEVGVLLYTLLKYFLVLENKNQNAFPVRNNMYLLFLISVTHTFSQILGM